MSLLTELSTLLGDAFVAEGLAREFGEVVVSQRPELAPFQCNGALAAAGRADRPPRDLAAAVAGRVTSDHRVAGVEVAGPGFLNLSVTDDYLTEVVARAAADPSLGVDRADPTRRIVVDYGGPNVAKALHVGHLRPAVIGESVKRILSFLGHDVVGDVHLGDWGAPMGQLIAELEDRRPELPYFDPESTGPYPPDPPVDELDLEELYPAAAARAKAEPDFAARARAATFALQDGRPGYRALWEHFRAVSVADLQEVYERMGVTFELWLGESSVHGRIQPLVERLLAAGVAVPSQGAVIVEVGDPDEDAEIPPLMLVKSDGAYTYGATDLATVEERVSDLSAQEIVYVVDVRQSLHFQQVFRAARRGGIASDEVVLEHAGNGTVNGLDGKPMRTREGGLPPLRGLLDAVEERATARLVESGLATGYPPAERAEIARLVGLSALKFGDLANHRTSNYVFDLERFTSFDGKTGPYLLYATVRIGSILRNAEERGLASGALLPPAADQERDLLLMLTRLPETIRRAADLRAPNHVAEYAFELAGAFNRFYEACHILSEPDPDRRGSWLALVDHTRRVLVTLLGLLAIEVPDRM
jgi:arginyl-tRNA synthetase